MHRRPLSTLAAAAAILALVSVACSDSKSSTATEASSGTVTSTTVGTAAANTWALDYTGGKAGKADASMAPIVIGYVNQEGGENSLVRKLIGQSRASNIVLTSGFVNAAALSDWREQVVNSGEKVRKSGSIIQYDSKMNEVTRWRFFNAIPIRWEMGEFDSMGTAAQCEILELAVESIKKGK